MQYRELGKNRLKVSAFGMGCMRLPITEAGKNELSSNIDRKEAVKMIRYALDHGVNYIDTAYGYHGGESEKVVGEALQEGYRAKAILATKLPMWLVKEEADVDRLFNEQLARLKTDHVDVYLLHALNKEYWETAKKFDLITKLEKYKEQGKIRAIAFSFRDELPLFKEIVDSYDWDMCQIQLNILDQDYQAGVAGLRYAADRNISVVAMEPLRGGKLALPPTSVRELYNEFERQRSPQEWGFRFLYDFPDICTILSGVSTMQQLKDNIAIFDQAKSNVLSDKEHALFKQAKTAFDALEKVNCTACRYCLPCPQGIDIPGIFSMYNNASFFETWGEEKAAYSTRPVNALKCIECGQCEAACPQNIKIIQSLKEAHHALIK